MLLIYSAARALGGEHDNCDECTDPSSGHGRRSSRRVFTILCRSGPLPLCSHGAAGLGLVNHNALRDALGRNTIRIVSGIIAACGAVAVLAAGRPISLVFFVPPLLLASLPYQTLTLETALLRNPIAFEREWESDRKAATEDDVAAASHDAERRARILDQPGGAWRP